MCQPMSVQLEFVDVEGEVNKSRSHFSCPFYHLSLSTLASCYDHHTVNLLLSTVQILDSDMESTTNVFVE